VFTDKAAVNSNINRPKSHSVDHQKTEVKEVKVMYHSGKRHTLAHVPQLKRDSWGGSVPAFFTTTHQELDIDDSLTPRKRRDSGYVTHAFQVCDSLPTERPVGNWEDQFQSRHQPKTAPRPKVGTVRVVRDFFDHQ